MSADSHGKWMQRALELASQAKELGEVPVGALVVRKGKILGEGFNQPILAQDPTAHAEIIALRQAALNTSNYRLPGSTLYVTIEPCTMCVGALIHARIDNVVFGAREPRAGALVSNLGLHQHEIYNHHFSVEEGMMAAACKTIMTDFFQAKRA